MVKPFLSIIIPALNEAERLPLTLIDMDKNLCESDFSYEIIVVSDGSTDSTVEMAGKFSSYISGLRVINIKDHIGRGSAISEAMKSARGNWRLIIDADNSISITEFEKVISAIKEGSDIVIGSRVRGSRIKNFPLIRRITEAKINFLTRLLLKSGVRDFLVGFQCYSEDAGNNIFSHLKLTGFDAQIESLILGERLGYKIQEVPVSAMHRPGSRFRFLNYFKIFWSIFKLRRWISQNAYGLKAGLAG
jgi:dolichyl-phosphate beta-glucosyltransferase